MEGKGNIISYENLLEIHEYLYKYKRNKAVGVDGQNAIEFDNDGNPEGNIMKLIEEIMNNKYKPSPVKRKEIPKSSDKNKKRKLGIPSYRDKIVQLCILNEIESVYENIFEEFSYGYRPERNSHTMINDLINIFDIYKGKDMYIIEFDIKSFFDNINHRKLMEFIRKEIKDKQILNLIYLFLKAGVINNGIKEETDIGTPQGGNISPLLANIYLHYVLDSYVDRYIKIHNKQDCYLIRYADDFIIICNNEKDALEIKQIVKKRLKKYYLELSKDKTKIIHMQSTDKKHSEYSVSFLGYQIYRINNKLYINTSIKKENDKYKDMLEKINSCSNKKNIKEIISLANSIIRGYQNYYGYNTNIEWLSLVREYIITLVSNNLEVMGVESNDINRYTSEIIDIDIASLIVI